MRFAVKGPLTEAAHPFARAVVEHERRRVVFELQRISFGPGSCRLAGLRLRR